MAKAEGIIEHKGWDEKPYIEQAPHKITKADIRCVFTGDLEAEAKTAYLMSYSGDNYAHYGGYLVISGTLDGKVGSFVVYETGEWDKGVARSSFTIVRDSGAGGLAGISGTGSYAAQHDKTVHYLLEYSL